MTLCVHGMHGLGDQLHQRPFIRAAASRETVYLQTPWPQLYRDLPNVYPVKAGSRLRTQAKNEARPFKGWHTFPTGPSRAVRMGYGSATMTKGSLHDALEKLLPLGGQPYIYDAPLFQDALRVDKPIAVVRPVTVRKEWSSVARNPLPAYLSVAADALIDAGYHIVTVADIEDGKEWFVDSPPWAHAAFHRGELEIERLFGLIRQASIVVTPVGWCLHAAIAYRRPVIAIAGGRGGHCAPWKETDHRQDLTRVRWMMPDRYCMCDQPAHDCPKEITDFRPRFERALASLT
jgi:ADP-heptose:LPS heptosyltransferase